MAQIGRGKMVNYYPRVARNPASRWFKMFVVASITEGIHIGLKFIRELFGGIVHRR
jgi:hypothetical protein